MNALELSSPSADPSEFIEIYSTGGFVVPGTPSPLSMHLYFSNAGCGEATIRFQVNQLVNGGKHPIISGDVTIPGQGADDISLDLTRLGLANRKLEVVFEAPLLPEFQVHASVSVVTGGAASSPVYLLSTGDFLIAKEIQVGRTLSQQGVPAFLNLLTWGFFDVPESTPQTEGEALVQLSSLSDQPETAIVDVYILESGSTARNRVLRQLVTVPAGEAEVLELAGFAGLAMEVVIELPFAQPPNTVLPLLSPSVSITNRNRTTGEQDPLVYLAPGQARFL